MSVTKPFQPPSPSSDDFESLSTDRTRLGSLQPLEVSNYTFSEMTIESPNSNLKSPDSDTRKSSNRESLALAQTITEGLDLNYSEKLRIEHLLSIISESDPLSEDLIMDEEIDFVIDKSPEGLSSNTFISFNYSKTDKSSTIFENLYSPYTLMNSLPHSPQDNCRLSFETFDPRVMIERKDLNWRNLIEEFEKNEEIGEGLGGLGEGLGKEKGDEGGLDYDVSNKESSCFCASCSVF